MKLPVYDGKNIVPVRHISFITEHELGPVTLSQILANKRDISGWDFDEILVDVSDEETGCHEQRLTVPKNPDKGVTAFYLDDEDKLIPIRPAKWDDICQQLLSLKSVLMKKDKKNEVPKSQVPKWRREAMKIMPPGVFLRRSDLELIWQAHRSRISSLPKIDYDAHISREEKKIIFEDFEHMMQGTESMRSPRCTKRESSGRAEMKLFSIGDRDIVPVRMIPFICATLAPETIAGILSHKLRPNGFPIYQGEMASLFDPYSSIRNFHSYYLGENGRPGKMLSTAWDSTVHKMKDIENEIKQEGGIPEKQLLQYKTRTLEALPPGVFVWRDELDTIINSHMNSTQPALGSRPDFLKSSYEGFVPPEFRSLVYKGFVNLMIPADLTDNKGEDAISQDHCEIDDFTIDELAIISGRDRCHIERLCETGALKAKIREVNSDLSKDDPFYKKRLLDCVHDWQGKELLKLHLEVRNLAAIPEHLSPRSWQIVISKDEWERFIRENSSFSTMNRQPLPAGDMAVEQAISVEPGKSSEDSLSPEEYVEKYREKVVDGKIAAYLYYERGLSHTAVGRLLAGDENLDFEKARQVSMKARNKVKPWLQETEDGRKMLGKR